MDILCLSPPESSQPFSPIIVFQPSDNFSANSSQCASFAAAITSSPSGGGKTTVSRLAARFWDADKGKITVGGMDISMIDPPFFLS